MTSRVVMLIVPILLGMSVRRRWPEFAARHGPVLLRLAVVGLALLIGVVIVQEGERLAEDFIDISLAVSILTVTIILAGWGTGRACALGPQDRFTLGMVFVVRNVAVATAVAVTVLGRTEFAVFATAYFLNQVPILIAALALFRLSRRSQARAAAKGTDREPTS